MSTTALQIINRVRDTLLDASAAVWSNDDLLDYMNEAQRAAVFLKLDANPVQEHVSLAAGVVQSIPQGQSGVLDGAGIIDVTHNLVGVALGRVVTLVDKELLDETNRFWPASTPEVTVENWCADPRDPTRFYVSPPNSGAGIVNIVYGGIPDLIFTTGQTIGLRDTYVPFIINYMLSQAYSKNSLKGDVAKTGYYMQQALQMLGIKSQSQVAVAPKVSSSPGM